MDQLQVTFGFAARDSLCGAFDSARSTIDAEFYSISDPAIVASLNHAALRGVNVELHVEGAPARYRKKPQTGRESSAAPDPSVVESLRQKFDPRVHIIVENHPDVLMHGKAAVVDGNAAFISTANPTPCGFANPGEVLVRDERPRDVAAVQASIDTGAAACADCVITGPAHFLRSGVDDLLDAKTGLRIATEDLSDTSVVARLAAREELGLHDRVLIEANGRVSRSEKQAVRELQRAGVEVRSLPKAYMHEKYVDDGAAIYVGSANLTRNGLDEAREVGIIAPAVAFGSGAKALRSDFDDNWNRAMPVNW